MGVKICEFCTYSWKALVPNPKSCPRCKRRFDYKDARQIIQKLGRKYGWDIDIYDSENEVSGNSKLERKGLVEVLQ